MAKEYYRGWEIFRAPWHPVMGVWRANRNGIQTGASSIPGLKRRIDALLAEEQEDQERRDRERDLDNAPDEGHDPESAAGRRWSYGQ